MLYIQVERVRREAEEAEQALKDRLQKMELQRIELEEEISRQKSNLASEKLHTEETLMSTKQKMKSEEVGCYKSRDPCLYRACWSSYSAKCNMRLGLLYYRNVMESI